MQDGGELTNVQAPPTDGPVFGHKMAVPEDIQDNKTWFFSEFSGWSGFLL